EAHATVDGLGGKRVTELVRMGFDVGLAADASHDTRDEVPIERSSVIDDEAAVPADVFEVVGGPGGEERCEIWVQWDVAVVAEFADGDSEPVVIADAHDCVG